MRSSSVCLWDKADESIRARLEFTGKDHARSLLDRRDPIKPTAMSGQLDEARRIFELSRKADPDNPVLLETLNRLKP